MRKIGEKVMLTSIYSTIGIIVICLVAMSITTYAYFSDNITSAPNMMKVAMFETKIAIQSVDKDNEVVNTEPITGDSTLFKSGELEPGKSYTITIVPTERSTATTGFVIVSAAGCDKIYHTQQIGADAITFKLKVTDTTDVIFLAHWGVSSYYDDYREKGDNEELYITHDEEIEIVINKGGAS